MNSNFIFKIQHIFGVSLTDWEESPILERDYIEDRHCIVCGNLEFRIIGVGILK